MKIKQPLAEYEGSVCPKSAQISPDLHDPSAHPGSLLDMYRQVLVFAHLDGSGGELGFVRGEDVEVGAGKSPGRNAVLEQEVCLEKWSVSAREHSTRTVRADDDSPNSANDRPAVSGIRKKV